MRSEPEPVWLPVAELVEINRDEVRETGENFALLRPELLESAAARPASLYWFGGERDLLVLATACSSASPAIIPSSRRTSGPASPPS